MDDVLREPAEPYVPQPGDIFLATEKKFIWRAGHKLALIGPPHHSGIVLARPDGRMALLEAGPFMSEKVEVEDLIPTLQKYTRHEKVWIRRRCTPLTPEQSACLTAFALAQEDKRFALFRILLQLTPARPRGPVKTAFMGKPRGDRYGWICAELVMEALIGVGLADPATTRPSPTSPRDLFFGRSRNPYIDRHLDLNSGWHPPARWTASP
jgi:hypothetical protein